MYVVVHVSFRFVHGEQPCGPEFQTHLRFRLRHRSQACVGRQSRREPGKLWALRERSVIMIVAPQPVGDYTPRP